MNFATYNFNTNQQISALNGNVTMYNNVYISNKAQGVINFNQASNSAKAGGIAVDGQSGNSKISNLGRINRKVTDGQDVTIAAPTTGIGQASYLFVDDACGINFLKKYKMEAGKFERGSKASRVTGFVGDSGLMLIDDPGAAGSYVTYNEDDLDIEGATVEFDITTPGATVTLSVAGNAYITAGSISDANGDPNGDSIRVAGDYDQSGGSVNLANGGGVTVAGATNLSGGTLQLAYGSSLSSAGTATISGTGTLSGTLVLQDASVTAASVQIQRYGILSGNGTVASTGGPVTNAGEVDADGGTLTVGAYLQTGGGTNIGLNSSSGVAQFTATGGFTEQGGTVNLYNSSTLEADGGLQIQQVASLAGYGTIIGNVTNAGSLTVSGGTSVVLSINGSYTQASTGALTIDLTAGTYPTTLYVSGTAALDGAFILYSTDGVAPSIGADMTPLAYGSLTGQFASLTLPAPSGGVWHWTYWANDLELSVQQS